MQLSNEQRRGVLANYGKSKMILKCNTDVLGGKKKPNQQNTTTKKKIGHEPNCLCFLGLLKGFVCFYYTVIDCFWERLTSLKIIPWFWVALLIHIKMSRKHFPLWCSYCLLSEAIPSEDRNDFACSWFVHVQHCQCPQLTTQAYLVCLLCKAQSRLKYFP